MSKALYERKTRNREGRMKNETESRREWLRRVVALGALAPAGISGLIQEALAKDAMHNMPIANGISSLSGSVTVNGKFAKVGTLLKTGDRIATSEGKGSYAVVVIGKDAFLLRENTSVVFKESEKPGTLETVLLNTGKLLAVFAKRPPNERVSIRAQGATIGIRGTGCYLEIHPKRTYFCLCYGEASIEGGGMDKARIVSTQHHEQPVWLDESTNLMRVEDTTFGNHTDAELIMLEKLTGREPPFVAAGLAGQY
jgi:ribosomal 50S subunit-recycling heat shock protein